MKMLVVGGTGGTGQAIVQQAIAAGHEVVALVRSPSVAAELLPGARLVEGDVRDSAAVDRAVAGCDAVVSALGSRRLTPFSRVTFLSEGTRTLVDAMRKNGVGRLVCITGVGAGDSRGHGGFVYDHLILPTVLRTMYEDKDRQEAVIRASVLDWTLVRPTILSDKPATGHVRALTDLGDFHGGTIPRADVAAFVVSEAAEPKWRQRAVVITTA